MYANDKEANRQFFIDVWRKASAGQALEPLEHMIAGIIGEHPEYHALLSDSESAVDREYTPESGEGNPFLHMGLHIAIQEQLSTNRPPGIVEIYQALTPQYSSTHELEHAMIECLGAALWQAQRSGAQPDEQSYIECLKKLQRVQR